MPHLRQYGQEVREETRQELVLVLEQTLAKPIKDGPDFVAKLKALGYQGQTTAPGKTDFIHEQTGARFPSTELRPNGQAIGPQLTAAIERTAEQAKSQTQDKGRSKGISMGGR